MRKRILVQIFATCLASKMASGQASPLDSAFGNTVAIVDAEGFETDVFVEKNGTFTGRLPDGSKFQGVWRLRGSEVCFTETAPYARSPLCFPDNLQTSGVKWHGKDAEGTSVSVSILPGRPQ